MSMQKNIVCPVWPVEQAFFLQKASGFCAEAHAGQKRKYTDVPYHLHCFSVADILWEYGYRETDTHCCMAAAAYLHDTVEDTPVQSRDIYREFGEEVGDLVFWLTNISRPEMGNRALRKRLDRLHIWGAPFEAQIIKCADCIDNARDIKKNDPDFATVYCREIEKLLGGMREETKHTCIWEEVFSLVQ